MNCANDNKEDKIFLETGALAKALESTSVRWFIYDVASHTITMSERTALKYHCKCRYENMPYSFADDLVRPEDRQAFNEMYEKINSGEEKADCVYVSKPGYCCHTTLTIVKRGENNVPLEAVGIVEDLSLQKKNEERYSNWINALGEMYFIRYYVNIVTEKYEIIHSRIKSATLPTKGILSEGVKEYCNKFVHEDDRGEFLEKTEPSYISAHLSENVRSYSFDYRIIADGSYHHVRSHIILVDTLSDGSVHHVIFTGQYIDIEKDEHNILETSLRMMRDSYYRIACINLRMNSMRSITITDRDGEMERSFHEDYANAIRLFANGYVLKEFREKFLNVMLPERLKALMDAGADYLDITYRRLEDGEPKWVRTELIPMYDYSTSGRVMWYVKNISDEKAVEEKLTKQLLAMNNDMNLRIETILNGISGGFKISREDEKISYEYVGNSAAALFGYTVDEFMEVTHGSAAENVYLPDREEALKEYQAQLSVGDCYSVKYRVRCKDGSLKWIIDSGKRITDESGKVLYYSLYHDVTELEESNIELKNAFTMLNRMVSMLKNGILAYRLPNREIILMNNEAKRLLDWDNTEPEKTTSIFNYQKNNLTKTDIEKIGELTRKLKEPGDMISYNFKLHGKSGTVTVSACSQLLAFEDGSRFILSSLQDISEQSELMELLREERRRYRGALVNDSEYAYSFDLTEGIIKEDVVTRSGVKPLKEMGLTPPISFDDFIAEWLRAYEPKFTNETMKSKLSRNALLELYESGTTNDEVEYYNEETGRYTRVTFLLSKSERTGHVIAFLVGKDTTELRERETRTKQALLDAYEAAKRANSAKSDFLSRMSHDIRTPMNAIIGMTAIAGTHLDNKERVADCLNKITLSSKHLLSLINEVLDMSKIESGKVDLNEEEFNISDIIDELISMVRPQIKAKEQELTVTIRDVVHEKVIGDGLRLQQAFVNFMSNAIKYTPSGGKISLVISEMPSRQPKVGRYEFIFEHNGIGMSPEFVERIFEPFARADDSRVSKIQGTGLGMAITNNLVRMMNGDIKVESTPGKGSKFTVTISLKLNDTESLSCDEFVDLPVLVADDERATCESACHILDEMGMKGEWVQSGEEAVEKTLQRHNEGNDYFAVILDWKMPGMDGIKATRAIRKQVGPDVTIIIISAYDWSDIELEARAAGADAFIGKPLFKSRLVQLFHEIMSGGEQISGDNVKELAKEDYTGKRALLAEDNELNAEIATEILNMTGLKVEHAENGQQAVDMFAASEPGYYDVVLMDIQMPIMNGNEAARAIRALSRRDAKGIPIIAMTANAFSDDIQAALAAGMNEHVSKPLDLKQLMTALRRWIGNN